MKTNTKISAYGFVRNGFLYGVPFIESILSVLPICDEFIMVVGDSNDGTREAIEKLKSSKINIIDTVWDDSLTQKGKIFALQSNIGLAACKGDWVIHIQADEVIHEDDHPLILRAIQDINDRKEIDGFVQPFLHFWGDYFHIRNSRRVHSKEIRIFKNKKGIRAFRDSQGFRKFKNFDINDAGVGKGEKLKILFLNVPIYHYSAVKNKRSMHYKSNNFQYYYGQSEQKLSQLPEFEFNYHQVDRVAKFTGSHPAVMNSAIGLYDNTFVHDTSQAVWKPKDKILQKIEDVLKTRFFEYKNFILKGKY